MKELIQLAEKIQDEELRKKVVEFLKDLRLSNPYFSRYVPEDMKKVKTPFTVAGYGTVERGDLINHIRSVVEGCVKMAEVVEERYGLKINKDVLIAGAILHDVMKVYEWKVEGDEVKHSGIMLDHSMLGVAELYARGFPEEVIHLVASHIGEHSPTPPRNFEALILHHVDTLMSLVEFHISSPRQPTMPVLVIDEESLKKMMENEKE
mgnify:CR=1 FL=1